MFCVVFNLTDDLIVFYIVVDVVQCTHVVLVGGRDVQGVQVKGGFW